MLGLVVDDGVAQRTFCDVLDADVDGGDNVVAVDGFDVVLIFDGCKELIADEFLFIILGKE